MTAADRRELEALADRLLRTPAARRVRAREKFGEAEGRAMFAALPGRSAVKPAFSEHGEIVATVDGRDEKEFDDYRTFEPEPSRVEAASDVLHFILHGGRCSAGAVLSRLCALARRGGLLSSEEARRLSGKTARTLRRHVRNVREITE